MTGSDRSRVFVSYAEQDAAWAAGLITRLREAGLSVFDRGDIPPGEVMLLRVEDGILDATTGILLFSRSSAEEIRISEERAVLQERARAGQVRFIPVLIEDVDLPPFTAIRQIVDFRDARGPKYDQRIAELIEAVQNQPPEPILTSSTPRVRPERPRSVLLQITSDQVCLTAEGPEPVIQRPGEERSRLEDLLWRVRRRRASGQIVTTEGDPGGGFDRELRDCGLELGKVYLAGAVGDALGAELAAAEQVNGILRIRMEIGADLAGSPWETLALDGGAGPLALDPHVQLYRHVSSQSAVPAMMIPGPLRILVAMASPDGTAGGETLDLEAELGRILDAVDPARSGDAYVRILNEGTLAGIRDALVAERYHVLHVSCHASPGVLLLEDEHGGPDPVPAERFVAEGLPAGRGVPLVVLSGCSTAVTGADDDGGLVASGLAQGLTAAGVPAVLAMSSPVTDTYATAFAATLYRELAMRREPEALTAFCDARRRLHQSDQLPADTAAEWPTPVLFLRGPALPLYDPATGIEPIPPPAEPLVADGIPLRRAGEFVGRRTELRLLLRALSGEAGVLLYGIGGIGKSTLAVETLRRRERAGLVVSQLSQTSPDQILDTLALTLLSAAPDEGTRRLVSDLRQPGASWPDRLALLRPLLARKPVTLFLDNFEDNLTPGNGSPAIADAELAAFLSSWIRLSGKQRLLITSRHVFTLPQRAEQRLHMHHLGPLSWPQTRKLMWRMDALNQLVPEQQYRAYAHVGGHPRTLEYLDALLGGGKARFHDVTERLQDLIARRGITDAARWHEAIRESLDKALAESITLAVDDVLLGDLIGTLSDPVRRLLIGVSVYRQPVSRPGLSWAASQRPGPVPPVQPPREPPGFGTALQTLEQLGLLSPAVGPGEETTWIVHRWTAGTLARLASPGQVKAAHEAAARYWMWQRELVKKGQRADISEQLITDFLEARYHFRAAGDMDWAIGMTDITGQFLHTWGAWSREEQLHRETLGWLPERSVAAARELHMLGNIARIRGDNDRAREYYGQALDAFGDHGERVGVAIIQHQLAMIADEQGNSERARDYGQQALSTFTESGEHARAGATLQLLGVIACTTGDYDRAEEYLRQSLDIPRHPLDITGPAQALGQLSVVAEKRGDHNRAGEYCRQALDIFTRVGDRAGVAGTLHQLAVIAHKQGNTKQALDGYRHALAICEELGDFAGMARSMGMIGALLTETDRVREAVDYSVRACAIDLQMGHPEAHIAVHWLTRQRTSLGPASFRDELTRCIGETSAENLLRMLDDWEAARRTGEQGTGTA